VALTTRRPSRRSFVKHAAATAGAVALTRHITADADLILSSGQGPEPSSPFPVLNRRSRGWLRFLWEKTTTPDDWSSSGVPHQWWDVYTTPGVQSYGRFDLQTSSYALLLMADQTPAWREVYTKVADGLASRFPTYWGAIDWLTQIGDDPKRANYPERDMQLMPERLRGSYNRVGWTANGIQPWGLQRDPIGADGYLFFRGWFNLVLTIYKYISGDDKWERPFMVTGYGDEKFEWDHDRIADLLARQYVRQEAGPHCENTKIWFSCNSAAALGLYLYDKLHGTHTYRGVETWLEYARQNYMRIGTNGKLESVTRYYDPLVDYKLNIAPEGGVHIALLLVPQHRELATKIYDAAANALGWRNTQGQPKASAPGLIVARELGDSAVVARLSAAAEREFEPRFFGNRDENFGWFFHLNEAYPRGQQSATMMVSEVGPEGSWVRAFEARHFDKFRAPTVEGIDFPRLGVLQAWNDDATGALHIGTYAPRSDQRGAETTWRITHLPNARNVSIRCDGQPFNRFDVTSADSIRINTTVDTHVFEIITGYHRDSRANNLAAGTAPSVGLPSALRTASDEPDSIRRAGLELLAGGGPKCPCCAG
jgi:Linalool dehydratase/isomerase